MSDDIPDLWRTAAQRKGISPTYRPVAPAADLRHETVRKVVQGRPGLPTKTLRKLEAALGVEVEVIYRRRGEGPPDYGREFAPDRAASLLTTEERKATHTVIRPLTLLQSEQKKVVGDAEHPTPRTQAGDPPEDEDPLWTAYKATWRKSRTRPEADG